MPETKPEYIEFPPHPNNAAANPEHTEPLSPAVLTREATAAPAIDPTTRDEVVIQTLTSLFDPGRVALKQTADVVASSESPNDGTTREGVFLPGRMRVPGYVLANTHRPEAGGGGGDVPADPPKPPVGGGGEDSPDESDEPDEPGEQPTTPAENPHIFAEGPGEHVRRILQDQRLVGRAAEQTEEADTQEIHYPAAAPHPIEYAEDPVADDEELPGESAAAEVQETLSSLPAATLRALAATLDHTRPPRSKLNSDLTVPKDYRGTVYGKPSPENQDPTAVPPDYVTDVPRPVPGEYELRPGDLRPGIIGRLTDNLYHDALRQATETAQPDESDEQITQRATAEYYRRLEEMRAMPIDFNATDPLTSVRPPADADAPNLGVFEELRTAFAGRATPPDAPVTPLEAVQAGFHPPTADERELAALAAMDIADWQDGAAAAERYQGMAPPPDTAIVPMPARMPAAPDESGRLSTCGAAEDATYYDPADAPVQSAPLQGTVDAGIVNPEAEVHEGVIVGQEIAVPETRPETGPETHEGPSIQIVERVLSGLRNLLSTTMGQEDPSARDRLDVSVTNEDIEAAGSARQVIINRFRLTAEDLEETEGDVFMAAYNKHHREQQ